MKHLFTLGFWITLASAGFAQGSRVTFRDDHTILVDGKPFFPIGLYYCAEEFEDASNKLLEELKDYGFNTLGYYRWGRPGWQGELKRAHQLGFKVWIRGQDGFALDSPAAQKAALDQVRQTRRLPALLFWEFQDEPILNKVSVEGSRRGYQLVKREDPDHPMLVVEWPGAVDRLHLWKGIGDVFSVDLYPIPRSKKYGRLPNHDITQIRDYIEAIKKAHGDRPIVLVLQAWAWAPLQDGKKGYPTPRESRFMAYQAVIHGARGLHYYGQFHCTVPNSASALVATAKDPAARKAEFDQCLKLNRWFWDQHRGFFEELKEASRLFVLRAARTEDRVRLTHEKPRSARGIESVTRQAGRQLYVLAVNADSQQRRATFQLPPSIQVPEVHVLFEKRTLKVKDGVFSDEFGPYDTHVYATTAQLPR